MATVLDVITEALERTNILAAGETPSSQDANRALIMFNDLVDSLSNEHLACYQKTENIYTLTSGQAIYTIGNPTDTSNIVGVVTSGSPTITGVTVFPADFPVGGLLIGAGIPTGTTILSFSTGANTVTMSANATATFAASTIQYTTPGNIP